MEAYFYAPIVSFFCTAHLMWALHFYYWKSAKSIHCFYWKGPFQQKCPLPLYTVDSLLFTYVFARQSRYLESKFRFQYILNWWPRGQDTPPPSCLESWNSLFTIYMYLYAIWNILDSLAWKSWPNDQNILTHPRNFFSGFAPGYNVHVVLGLSYF